LKISIITPSYNQAKYIERTIKSILNQDYKDVEYIIIDGGSTDGTLDIIKNYQSRIIWVSEMDNGQSNAINKGLRLATGEIITFINSDDTYEPNSFKEVINFFENNPDKKWVYGKCRIISENDKEIRKPITFYKNLLLKNYSYSKLLSENFISQPATFWRKDIINEIGYLNENEYFCMDYEFWLRIGEKYDPGVIDEYLANFRLHTMSKSGSNNKKQFQDELRLAKKFGTKHPISVFLHKLNYFKIIWIYKLLQLFK
jgi:glycosyltransferase involved in cell wall biosynthesis